LLGGGTAATLDIAYAILRYNRSNALAILQSVASGWLGRDAFNSGWTSGMLGLAPHFAILLVAAASYCIASRRSAVLQTKPVPCGALFGVLIYLLMNSTVSPPSAYPFNPKYSAFVLFEGFTAHALLVGLPIASAVSRIGQRG
jgi:hypothetical protein